MTGRYGEWAAFYTGDMETMSEIHEIERAAGALEQLYGTGGLSEESKDALLAVKTTVGLIGSGLGEAAPPGELLLASVLVDDSSSIGPLIAHVRHGHQLMHEALQNQSHSAHVQVLTRALNRGLIAPYENIAHAMALTEDNFSGKNQIGRTPLYLQSLLTLGAVMTKAQEAEAHGSKVRTFTLIITDGADNWSGAITIRQVRAVVKDMLEFATNHIVAGMGIGESYDFRAIFQEMGIPERSIYTAGATVKDLEAEFRKIAKDLGLAASSETEFRQLAVGSSSG